MAAAPRARLDHLVFAVPQLLDGVRAFAEEFGVEPVVGGSHPGLGTANYLVGLAGPGAEGAYLEILGPDPVQAGAGRARWNLDIDEVRAPRLHPWAVRSDDFDGALASARAAGVDLGTAEGSARETPDGAMLRWRLTTRSPLAAGGSVPFLIDWMDSPHPSSRELPVLRLEELTILAPDPDAHARRLAAIGVTVPVEAAGGYGLRAVVHGPTGTKRLGGTP